MTTDAVLEDRGPERGVVAPDGGAPQGEGVAAAELDESAVRDALDRCIDALCEVAVRAGDRAGWLTWEPAEDGLPRRLVGGRSSLYDGDAGVAWALSQLAVATDRSDLLELAVAAARTAARASVDGGPGTREGLLDGAAGVAVAIDAVRAVDGSTTTLAAERRAVRVPRPSAVAATDLTSGVAGVLLGQVRTGTCGPRTIEAIRVLGVRSRRGLVGVSWPDPTALDPVEARPLCGLSHGNSGIALALAEAAVAFPGAGAGAGTRASALAAQALAWEAAWFDPIAGGWPDLRGGEPTFPAMWCHGAAGVGVARLRLLRLVEEEGLDLRADTHGVAGAPGEGLDVAVDADTLRAEAEAAVQACGAELARAVDAVPRVGEAALAGGLTLCHGLGGPLDVLTLAHRAWGVRGHLDAARHFAAAIVGALDRDPLLWPAGVRAPGSAGLFVGVAGAAVVLARLAHPEAPVASPSLLG